MLSSSIKSCLSSPIRSGLGSIDNKLIMLPLLNNRVYQRSTFSDGGESKGQGTIPITINNTKIQDVYARTRSSTGVILQSAFLVESDLPIGVQTIDVSGIDARLGWFYLDIAPTALGPWTNGRNLVGMGRVIFSWGQSQAVRFFRRFFDSTPMSVTCSDYGVCYAQVNENSQTYGEVWSKPAETNPDYNSNFAAEFLNLQIAAAGVNCALTGYTYGGQEIAWFTGVGKPSMDNVLDAIGGFETCIGMQGGSDSALGSTATFYQGKLSEVYRNITARNTIHGADFDKVYNTSQNTRSGVSGTVAQILVIRNAAKGWFLGNGSQYIQPEDIDLYDDVHQSNLGNINLARHFYRGTRPGLGLSHNDDGATLTSASRIGTDITINFTLPSGATALSGVGSPATRFNVYAAGSIASSLALDATTPITIGASTITLKLAADPGAGTSLDVYMYKPLDPSSQGQNDNIYDDNLDGDGLTTGRHVNATLVPVPCQAQTTADIMPVNTVAPVLSGGVLVGEAYTLTDGTWLNSPTSYIKYITVDGVNVGYPYTRQEADRNKDIIGYVIARNNAALPTAVASNTLNRTTYGYKTGTNLTPTSATYTTASGTGFTSEQALNGGYAQSSVVGDTFPAGLQTWAIEARGRLTATGALGYIIVQSNKAGIQVSAANVIQGTYRDTLGNNITLSGPNISDMVVRHVALSVSASGGKLFVNGTQVAQSALPAKGGAGSGVFNVRSLAGTNTFQGEINEVAVWNFDKYTASFTPPAAPYVGNEGMTSLWHFDGDANAATY